MSEASSSKTKEEDVAFQKEGYNPNFDTARDAMRGANLEMDDDGFIKKFSGPLILGPFVPALFAVFTIFYGQILVNTWEGTCGYALDAFISAAIAVCYIFLLVYMWVFIGTELKIQMPYLGEIRGEFAYHECMSV